MINENILIFLVIGAFFLVGCALINKKKVENTAHRGASGLAPENTLAAMRKALEYQVDYIELDVQETKDGQIIVLHDDDIKRTSNRQGVIWEMSFNDLKDVDAGSWKNPEFKGEPIPLLRDVINLVRGKAKLNIELKINGHQKALEERVVKIILEENFIENCILTSFHLPSIEKVKRIEPRIYTGLILDEIPDFDVWKGNWEILSVLHSLVDADFVERAHNAGKKIHVWTVNEPALMQKLIDSGVDNLITNRPDILRKLISQNL